MNFIPDVSGIDLGRISRGNQDNLPEPDFIPNNNAIVSDDISRRAVYATGTTWMGNY